MISFLRNKYLLDIIIKYQLKDTKIEKLISVHYIFSLKPFYTYIMFDAASKKGFQMLTDHPFHFLLQKIILTLSLHNTTFICS
jgi:hypothetical protein